jgi:hypothetical protein
MIAIVISIFAIVAILCYLEEYLGKYNNLIYIFIGFLLCLIAGFKDVNSVNDANTYKYYFEHYYDPILSKGVEFSFLWFSSILYPVFHSVCSIFILYAFISVPSKLYAIRKISPHLFLPLLIYISNIYILHDLTQIRAAVASGFFLISIYYISKGNIKYAFVLILVAIFFHYSSLSLLPLLFLSNKKMKFKQQFIWGALIPLGYIIYFLHINLLLTIPIPYISNKIAVYQELTEKGIGSYDQINVFSLVYLVNIIIFYYNLYFYDTIYHYCKLTTLIIKIQALSLFFFPAFAIVPVIGLRLSELYGIVNIFAYANIFYTIKQKIIGITITILAALCILIINILYNHLIF